MGPPASAGTSCLGLPLSGDCVVPCEGVWVAGAWFWASSGSDPQTKVMQSNNAKTGRATGPFTPFKFFVVQRLNMMNPEIRIC